MKDVIKETQNVLSNGGNVIKTRDDRELILVDKDGNIQNADSCGWLPENDGKINKSVFRTRIEPWLTSLFPVFVIGTPKFQDRVLISTKSYSLRCSSSIPSILSTACLERA